jgi:hypothetical protein
MSVRPGEKSNHPPICIPGGIRPDRWYEPLGWDGGVATEHEAYDNDPFSPLRQRPEQCRDGIYLFPCGLV